MPDRFQVRVTPDFPNERVAGHLPHTDVVEEIQGYDHV